VKNVAAIPKKRTGIHLLIFLIVFFILSFFKILKQVYILLIING
jgi:hypothetical protein